MTHPSAEHLRAFALRLSRIAEKLQAEDTEGSRDAAECLEFAVDYIDDAIDALAAGRSDEATS